MDLVRSGQYRKANQKDIDYLIGTNEFSIEDGVGNQMAINRWDLKKGIIKGLFIRLGRIKKGPWTILQ